MKKHITLIFVLSIIRVAAGEVSIRICEADGEIPFKGRKITVGTKLAIIVSSDRGGYWNGGLFITGQNRAYGILTARDFNPKADDWEGSHYEAAGGGAIVSSYQDSWMRGFDLCAGTDAEPGDWFIIDYAAVDIGNSNVGFYEYYLSWDDPNFIIDFSHVPTRDFHVNDILNFLSFTILVSNGMKADCNEPNWYDMTDISDDGNVNIVDLGLFTEDWLWKPLGRISKGRRMSKDPVKLLLIIVKTMLRTLMLPFMSTSSISRITSSQVQNEIMLMVRDVSYMGRCSLYMRNLKPSK